MILLLTSKIKCFHRLEPSKISILSAVGYVFHALKLAWVTLLLLSIDSSNSSFQKRRLRPSADFLPATRNEVGLLKISDVGLMALVEIFSTRLTKIKFLAVTANLLSNYIILVVNTTRSDSTTILEREHICFTQTAKLIPKPN